MDFAVAPEHKQFAAALHDMLAAADGLAAARGWSSGDRGPGLKIWRALADAGVTALAVPADRGGLDAHPAALVMACEEIGHHAVPGPVAESLAVAPQLLAAASGPETGGFLAQLAAGDLIATVAAPPLAPYAADTEVAGLVLLAEPELGQISVGRPDPGRRSVDPARTVAEVAVDRLIAAGSLAAKAIARAVDCGALATSAQLLGAGRAMLEASARHARERVQFGRPVGSFQAVKHQLADVLIGLEFARPLLYAAAVALAADSSTATRDVSAARVACADAAQRAARAGLQVHGAIGYTAEHDASLWLAKIEALRRAWGSQAWHRAQVLAALCDRRAACG
ncbi:MAG TPA: acyl-CoA dehydrogenase family protein [Streptosporangiaceae bacterium]|nr:acyl-CoA dehydrogenase family protein [Streptosporangiaceae bacterium]